MMAYTNGPTVEQREYAKKQYKSHTEMFFVVLYVVIYYHSGDGLIRQLRSVEIPVGTVSTKLGAATKNCSTLNPYHDHNTSK